MATLTTNIQRAMDLLLPKIKPALETKRPIILGVTGLQGSGKSTWSAQIVSLLSTQHNIRAITVSLDDFYKAHEDLVARREKDPGNALFRTRGQPGTHDEELAVSFFESVKQVTQSRSGSGEGEGAGAGAGEIKIPRFDKSAFNGEGDRVPESEWDVVSGGGGGVDVVVFEGWCVGYQALSEAEITARWAEAVKAREEEKEKEKGEGEEELESTHTLADHALEHLVEMNRNLERYNQSFMGPQNFDFMIHIDTDELRNVYRWRAQQEEALVREKGRGMSFEAVARFVRGYVPAYELYLEGLRKGLFGPGSGRQVRVVMGREREVRDVEVI
jgi:D-glycerate 3-kinase